MIDVGLFLSYILIGICALAAAGMPLVKAFDDPQSLKKMGIGVGTLVVLFIIGYLFADSGSFEKASAGTSRLVGAGLITLYIISIVGAIAIIYTEISKALSDRS